MEGQLRRRARDNRVRPAIRVMIAVLDGANRHHSQEAGPRRANAATERLYAVRHASNAPVGRMRCGVSASCLPGKRPRPQGANLREAAKRIQSKLVRWVLAAVLSRRSNAITWGWNGLPAERLAQVHRALFAPFAEQAFFLLPKARHQSIAHLLSIGIVSGQFTAQKLFLEDNTHRQHRYGNHG